MTRCLQFTTMYFHEIGPVKFCHAVNRFLIVASVMGNVKKKMVIRYRKRKIQFHSDFELAALFCFLTNLTMGSSLPDSLFNKVILCFLFFKYWKQSVTNNAASLFLKVI